MNPDRSRRAMALMCDALDVARDQREAFLAAACTEAGATRDEARSLLAAHECGAGFLAPLSDAFATPSEHRIETIAGYRILEELGSGGMGTVYLAEQRSPSRRVALKVLAGPWTPTRLARFALEAEALARLRHPGIAVVYEAAVDGEGAHSIPYLAIELVENAMPITDFAAAQRLDLPRRLELFRQVCDAVHHGHQKGVIHRDLKPSNILVDEQGVAKVIDFGIARLVDMDDAQARLTNTGLMIGTPAFMSPEQWTGDPAAVDVRSDVYVLGAVLYELLCGRPAFGDPDPRARESLESMRCREPRRPRSIVAALPRDLETILLTALDRDPARRYASVAALSADIARFLDHRPIEAQPATTVHQVRLFARRHRPAVMAASVAAAALVAGTVVSAGFAVAASRNANERGIAEAAALRDRDTAVRRTYIATMAAAESSLHAGEFQRLQQSLEAAPAALRGWEWRHLVGRADRAGMVLDADARRVFGVAVSPDGARLWSGGSDGALRCWDTATGTLLHASESRERGIACLELSPDGTLIASAGSDGRVIVQGVERDFMTRDLEWIPGEVLDVAFSQDSLRLAAAGRDGTVAVWDIATGARLMSILRTNGANAVLFDGSDHLVIASADLRVDLVSAESGEVVRSLARPDKAVVDMAWLRRGPERGEVLLLAQHDWTARAIDMRTEAAGSLAPEVLRLQHPGNVWSLAVAPDGETFATGCGDMRVRIWRTRDGELLNTFGGHSENVHALAFDPSGSAVWSACWDGTVRRWDVNSRDQDRLEERQGIPVLSEHDSTVQAMAFAPRGPLLASVGRDGRICLWDHTARRLVRSWSGHADTIWSVAFSPDGELLATGLHDGTIALWRVDSGDLVAELRGHEKRVYTVAFSADGRRLASGSLDRTARVWERDESGQWCTTTIIGHDAHVWVVAFSPDGKLLASACWDRTVRLSDPDDGTTIGVFAGHSDSIYAMAFSADGSLLASGGRDQRVILWDVSTRTELRRLEGHGQFITGLAFSHDGSRLAASSWFDRALLWDPSDGALLLTMRAAGGSSPRSIAISSDDGTIATAGQDGLVWLWEG